MVKDSNKTAIPFKWDGVKYPSLHEMSKAVGINYSTLTEWYRKGVISEKLKERLKPSDLKYYSGIDKSLSEMTFDELDELRQDYFSMIFMIDEEVKRRIMTL